jgi:hypothetical protein
MSSEQRLGLLERLAIKALQRLNIDGNGRLRVAAESVANIATLTTCSTCTTCTTCANVTNITNWGAGVTPTAFSQYQSMMAFQSGQRARIVKNAE